MARFPQRCALPALLAVALLLPGPAAGARGVVVDPAGPPATRALLRIEVCTPFSPCPELVVSLNPTLDDLALPLASGQAVMLELATVAFTGRGQGSWAGDVRLVFRSAPDRPVTAHYRGFFNVVNGVVIAGALTTGARPQPIPLPGGAVLEVTFLNMDITPGSRTGTLRAGLRLLRGADPAEALAMGR